MEFVSVGPLLRIVRVLFCRRFRSAFEETRLVLVSLAGRREEEVVFVRSKVSSGAQDLFDSWSRGLKLLFSRSLRDSVFSREVEKFYLVIRLYSILCLREVILEVIVDPLFAGTPFLEVTSYSFAPLFDWCLSTWNFPEGLKISCKSFGRDSFDSEPSCPIGWAKCSEELIFDSWCGPFVCDFCLLRILWTLGSALVKSQRLLLLRELALVGFVHPDF
mmetsp:Transcript_129625/g.224012  ORF Transcript_129625/g.224012 Transcript_129625/m.224012 type:complete len:218 (+) Transcript_129625:98-751(+)